MSGARRAYPYYKIQVYDTRSLTWMERKKGFNTLDEAKRHIARFLTSQKARIVLVDDSGYRVLDG
jgi:hypothetical protein